METSAVQEMSEPRAALAHPKSEELHQLRGELVSALEEVIVRVVTELSHLPWLPLEHPGWTPGCSSISTAPLPFSSQLLRLLAAQPLELLELTQSLLLEVCPEACGVTQSAVGVTSSTR